MPISDYNENNINPTAPPTSKSRFEIEDYPLTQLKGGKGKGGKGKGGRKSKKYNIRFV